MAGGADQEGGAHTCRAADEVQFGDLSGVSTRVRALRSCSLAYRSVESGMAISVMLIAYEALCAFFYADVSSGALGAHTPAC